MKSTALLLALASGTAIAAPFTAGNLLVYRVGSNTGSDTMANTGNAVFIDEWTTTGTYVQSINTGVFASGTSTSEGLLTRSPNGQYVTFTGYASTNGANLTSSASATINRTVGVLTPSGTITKTNFSDFSTAGSPRSATTTNGTDLWMAGAAGGVRYGTSAGGTSTQLSTTPTNIRDVEIFNDQVYISTSSGTSVRVGTVGTGLPTTAGNTITNLPGFVTTGSPYEFAFADLSPSVSGFDTLYVADDAASGGQIQKYSLVGGVWTASGSIAAAAVRGLTINVSGGNVSIFGSTGSSAAAGAGAVYSLVDGSGYNATLSGTLSTLFSNTTLQTSLNSTGASFAFRGVEFVPAVAIPEPSAFAALAGLGVLGLAAGRRRRA